LQKLNSLMQRPVASAKNGVALANEDIGRGSKAPRTKEGVALANEDIGRGSKDPRRQCNAPTKYPVGALHERDNFWD
jgi:hypothetical protein